MNDDNQYKNIDDVNNTSHETNDVNNTSHETNDVVDTVPPMEEVAVENKNISKDKKEEIVRETIPALKPEDLYGYQPEKKEEIETIPPTTASETTAPVEV